MKKEQKTITKLPANLEAKVNESGIELSKAQAIAAPYAPLMVEAQEMAENLKGLTTDNLEDVAKAKRIRLDLGKLCSTLKTQKDNDKAAIKIEDRYIMGLYNTVEGFARLTQQDAEKIEKHAERKEAQRLEKVKTERLEKLQEYEVDGTMLNVEHMTDEVWENYLNGVKLNYEQKKEAERKAEEERLEKERKAKVYNERKNQLLPLQDFINIDLLTEESTQEEFDSLLQTAQTEKEKAAEVIRLHNDRSKELADFWTFLDESQKDLNFGLLSEEDYAAILQSVTQAKADQEAEEAKKQLHTERTNQIAPYSEFIPAETDTDLSNLDEGEYQSLYQSAKDQFEKREEDRKAAEAKAKAEALKSEKEQLHASRVKYIATHYAQFATKDELEADYKEMSDGEWGKLESDLESRKKTAEAEEAKKQKEQENARKAPDYDKIVSGLNSIVCTTEELATEEGRQVWDAILVKLDGFQSWALKEAEKLKA